METTVTRVTTVKRRMIEAGELLEEIAERLDAPELERPQLTRIVRVLRIVMLDLELALDELLSSQESTVHARRAQDAVAAAVQYLASAQTQSRDVSVPALRAALTDAFASATDAHLFLTQLAVTPSSPPGRRHPSWS